MGVTLGWEEEGRGDPETGRAVLGREEEGVAES